ncbi:MAG TPA: WG repeat-containing protein, partial [bacterium]|nr:WG repeat-containing protein [bacterium]
MDASGKIIIKPQYLKVRNFSSGLAAVLVLVKEKKDSKMLWGYIDTKGKMVIKPAYEAADDFGGDLAGVQINKRWGFIDKTGKVVIDFLYDATGDKFEEGIIMVKVGEKYGLINTKGEVVLEPTYKNFRPFRDGFAAANDYSIGCKLYVGRNGKVLPVDIDKIDSVSDFKDGFAVISRYNNNAVIGTDGTMVFKNSHSINWVSEGVVCASHEVEGNIKISLYNIRTKKWIGDSFEDHYKFSEGLAGACTNKRCGFIDKEGAIVVPLTYDEVRPFNDGLAPVRIGRTWGYIDKTGKKIIDLQFDNAGPFANGVGRAVKDSEDVYINKTGKVIGAGGLADGESKWIDYDEW